MFSCFQDRPGLAPSHETARLLRCYVLMYASKAADAARFTHSRHGQVQFLCAVDNTFHKCMPKIFRIWQDLTVSS